MRYLFLLFLFLFAPLAFLYSAQEPPDTPSYKAYLRSYAEEGDAVAQYNLGNLYAKGHGVARDYVEARKWYLKGAEQGHANAQYDLGRLYDEGHGVAQDYVKARKWYLKVAEQGHGLGPERGSQSRQAGRRQRPIQPWPSLR